MQTSHYFEAQISKAEKKHRQDPSFPLHQSIAESFVRTTNLPKNMAQELYDQFGTDKTKLIKLVDFFNEPEAQDIQDHPFTREEWQELAELSNRFADEIELERLQAIYQFFIAHHLLKHQQSQE